MVLFKDIAKKSSDFLTRDFPHDKPWDVETKCRKGNPQFINCATATAAGGVDATSSIKYAKKPITSEIKVTSGGGALVDVSCSVSKYVEGLSLGTRWERKNTTKASVDSGDISCEYEKGRLHSRAVFNPLFTTFNASSVVTCKAFNNTTTGGGKGDLVSMGGELNGGVDLSSVKYTVGAAYSQRAASQSQWSLVLRTYGDMTRGLDRVVCNIHTKTDVPAVSEMGVEVKHTLADSKTNMQFGAAWDLNPTTSVKARIGNDAQLAVALSTKFSEELTGVLGVQMDTTKLSNPDSLKYGLKLYCKA
eukprot:GHVQ01001707.1.p1 GENE.GHVQ01001707.1~~GHVQ01001707.1.p1  ORF type:complete len:304 (+),score=55.33 GHVQ01001707.1:167-1078(+)